MILKQPLGGHPRDPSPRRVMGKRDAVLTVQDPTLAPLTGLEALREEAPVSNPGRLLGAFPVDPSTPLLRRKPSSWGSSLPLPSCPLRPPSFCSRRRCAREGAGVPSTREPCPPPHPSRGGRACPPPPGLRDAGAVHADLQGDGAWPREPHFEGKVLQRPRPASPGAP